jgi:hypothetical protein
MMADWQSVTVGLLVALSGAVLLRRVYRALRGAGGSCGACGSCPATTAGPRTLLSIEPGPPGQHPAAKR